MHITKKFLVSLTALALVATSAIALSPKTSAASTTAVFAGRACPASMDFVSYNRLGEYVTCKVKKSLESPKKASVKKQNKVRDTEATDAVVAAEPEAPAVDNPAPRIVSNTSLTSKPAVATVKPEVNITVFTSVKSTSKRIGSVKIKVERAGGGEKCNNRTKTIVSSNPLANVNGKKTKGMVRWLGCTAGTYTVTNLGRKGYVTVGNTTKILQDADFKADHTAIIHFSLEKAPKATTGKNGGTKAN